MERPAQATCPIAASEATVDAVGGPEKWTQDVRDRLVRLAYRFVWNQADAEDVVHDALATAHERRGDLRDETKWWPWVCRIVVQRCRQYGRTKLRRTKLDEAATERAATRQVAAMDASRDLDRLRAAIADLPQRQREVIVLRHLQGMAFEQIAEVLDIAPATARVHARAGREALRARLARPRRRWFGR